MAGQEKHKSASTRAWVSGLAVSLTTIVAYLAFWKISPIATFLIGCAALVGLLIAGYFLGAETKQSQAKSPLPPNDRLS